MRIDDLVSERASGQVGPLRDVENLVYRRLRQSATLRRPELTEDPEERGLAAAVGTRDEQVHSWLNLKVHLFNQLVTVWTVDRDVLEDDVVVVDDFGTLTLLDLDVCLGFILGAWHLGRDHNSLVPAIAQVCKHLFHLVYQSRIAGQILHLLVGDYQSTDCFGQVDQEGGVSHVVLRDLSLIVAELGQVRLAVGAEDGQAHDSVAHHDCAVLDEH